MYICDWMRMEELLKWIGDRKWKPEENSNDVIVWWNLERKVEVHTCGGFRVVQSNKERKEKKRKLKINDASNQIINIIFSAWNS